MANPIFANGLNGLSDSKWSGVEGSADKIVGIDFRTTPGVIQAHQAMAKASSTTIDELCKVSLAVSDGSVLWFSSESGKIWRESAGTYTLVHTTVPTTGSASCTGAKEYDSNVWWATEDYVHKISVSGISGTWATYAEQNYGLFHEGVRDHDMQVQNGALFIADGRQIGKIETPFIDPVMPIESSVGLSAAVSAIGRTMFIEPVSATAYKHPEFKQAQFLNIGSAATGTKSFTVTPGPNRILVVVVSSWREDSTTPSGDTGVTFDGHAMTSPSSGSGSLDSTRYKYGIYYYVAPDVKTADVVVTWAGTESANRAIQIFQFNDAKQTGAPITIGVNDAVNTSTFTLTETDDMDDYEYHSKLMYVRTRTAGTTYTFTDTEIQYETTGNGNCGASISTTGIGLYEPTTLFSLKAPEYITALHPFDIDLLIGTKTDNVNKARVLRWDTANANYSADDDVDESGINAFIKDDNFVYVQAGDYGRLYYYNGEKLEPYKRIPGAWSPSASARVYPNAVAFHMGLPVFGISNVTGNPLLQGIYGLGSYSSQYPKVLSLDFPLLETSGLTIGAIVAKGADLYASYKTATDVGVCKLNWSAKYDGAYLETRMLTPLKLRSDLTTASRIFADYTSLPTSTDISISVKKKYNTSYTTLTTKNDTRRMQVRADVSVPEIANLQIKVGLTTNANNSPVIENIAYE